MSRKYDLERRKIRQEIMQKAKNVPCADCGKSYPYYVMDFDHVRGTKVLRISAMQDRKLEVLEEEIAKCDVVCANCHRERTYGIRPS